ncbi:NADH:flavin oxidoreductase/NADH oxidase [Brevifollis gellanilyticus]|uniref:NADH:flavin oxidoreductase/NADH oxidase n=1 Tax=Brevifollis gellanilyticus TaxID=748831 RepID=A0A512MDD2_9BACT|nr:NADH:flavin oxidoreductase/NADH oxidase [Brevifollis gellanilyticus]GEP44728.1 NADH:flavin oxidoreductase/NADH oxidase [Brevifollis gellanilyticus]
MTPKLFTPFSIKGVTLRNRIAVSPMCQYMAVNGLPTDWHPAHYESRARGGPGLVTVEATAVSPEGRITPGCLGLWSDEHAAALRPIVQGIKAAGAVPGIQIGHAGRKASANLPWEGDDHIPADDPRAWETIAPSPLAYGGGLSRVPTEMTKADIARVREDFVATAKRARDTGFEFLLLHFAHGYLAQNFLSPWSNQRSDEYGGSAENRARFMIETLEAVRAVWPDHLPLAARLGVIEFDQSDEQTLAESIALGKRFKELGLDFLDVSMSFSTPTAKIPWGPGQLRKIAQRVLAETGLPGSTSWNINSPALAEEMLQEGSVDMVMIGRPMLANPHWAFAAARELGLADPVSLLPSPYAHWLSRYHFA